MISIAESLKQIEYHIFHLLEALETQQLNAEELKVFLSVRNAYTSIQQARKDWAK